MQSEVSGSLAFPCCSVDHPMMGVSIEVSRCFTSLEA